MLIIYFDTFYQDIDKVYDAFVAELSVSCPLDTIQSQAQEIEQLKADVCQLKQRIEVIEGLIKDSKHE